jgi:phage-related protein
MAGPSVLVRIMGDASDFSKAASVTQSAAGKVASAVGNTIAGAARLAATALTVAGGAAVAFGISSFQTAARVGEMNATLKALSKGNDDVYKAMTGSVNQIRKQGVEAGVAQNLVAQFSRNQLSLADATKLASVAQDAAVISGQNSSEVLDQLTHGIITQNSQVLRNAGVNVQAGQAIDAFAKKMGKSTKELTDAERSQAVLNAVIAAGIPIQGAYAAAMEEPGKVLRSFPRLFDDIKLTVGEGLVNAFGPLILKLYDLVKVFSASIGEGGKLRPILDAINNVVLKMAAPLSNIVSKASAFLKAIPPETVEKIAGSISGLGSSIAGVAGTIGVMGAKNIPILGQLLGGINPLVAGIATFIISTKDGQAAIKSIVEAFKPFLSVIGEVAGALKGGLMDVLVNVAGVIEALAPIIAGTLVDVLQDLMQVVAQLLPVFSSIVPLLADLARVVIDVLGSALRHLLPMIVDVAQVIGGALVQALPVVINILRMLAPIVNAAADAFSGILKVVAPLIPPIVALAATVADVLAHGLDAILPPILELAKALGGALAGGIKSLLPLVQTLASVLGGAILRVLPTLQNLFTKLTPIIIKLVDGAFKVLAPVLDAVVRAVEALLPPLVRLIDSALSALLPILPPIIDAFLKIANVVANVLIKAVDALTPVLVKILDALAPIIEAVLGLLPPIADLAAELVAALMPAVEALLPPIVELLNKAIVPLLVPILQLIKPLADLVVALTPIITLVANLLAIIVKLIASALTPLITILSRVLVGVIGGVVSAIAGLIGWFAKMLSSITGVFTWVQRNWPLIAAILTGPIGIAVLAIVKNFDAIKAGIDKVFGWFRELPGKIGSALASLGSSLYNIGSSALHSMLSGLSAAWHSVWGWITGIPRQIMSVFNIDLFAAGKAILESLGRGIVSAGQGVIDKAKGIADKVKGLWPFSPAEWGPFRENPPQKAGEAIIRQIAEGMVKQQAYLERTAASVAQSAAIDASYLAPTGTEGATRAGQGAAARGPAVLIQNATFTDDIDVDVLMRRAGMALAAGTV